MSAEPSQKPNTTAWGAVAVAALVLYVASMGLVHGLYYNDRLPDPLWEASKIFHGPILWLEAHTPLAEPMEAYKYKCYIALRPWRSPWAH